MSGLNKVEMSAFLAIRRRANGQRSAKKNVTSIGRQTDAGEEALLLKRSVRQVRRLQRRLESEGDSGVIHRLRGKSPNNSKDNGFRQQVIDLYRRDLARSTNRGGPKCRSIRKYVKRCTVGGRFCLIGTCGYLYEARPVKLKIRLIGSILYSRFRRGVPKVS